MVDTVTGIRKAGQSKSKKYGRLELPYIIAMNVIEQFTREWSVVDALFGREAVRHIAYLDGSEKIEQVREFDGLWLNKQGPINENISAVLAFLGLKPWNLATVESILIENPFAYKLNPDQSDARPLTEMEMLLHLHQESLHLNPPSTVRISLKNISVFSCTPTKS